MSNFNWYPFLKKASKEALWNYEYGEIPWNYVQFPPDAIESEWLGFPKTSEEKIVDTEARLGTKLPPSYREFLKVTNGWLEYPGVIKLRGIDELCWFYIENQEWINIWITSCKNSPLISDEEYLIYGKKSEEYVRLEYLQTSLQISDVSDGEVMLLNPKIIHNNEWEAWLFSNHIPGARRYRSFWKMLTTRGMGLPS